jgi:hypothetical protein
MTKIPKLILRKEKGQWYIYGLEITLGPYPTRSDASETKRGLLRTYKHWREPGFVTSEKPRRQKL